MNRNEIATGRTPGYFCWRRCQRVFFSSFLCLCFRIFLRRFLMMEPIRSSTLTGPDLPGHTSARFYLLIGDEDIPQIDPRGQELRGHARRPKPQRLRSFRDGRDHAQAALTVFEDSEADARPFAVVHAHEQAVEDRE